MIDSMIFYRSFYDGIKILPQKEQNALFNSIFEYAFYGKEQKLEGTAKGMWMLIKPQIDANLRRRENGAKGGRPKTNGSEKEKPMVSETKNQTETNGSETGKPNVNVNVNDNANGNGNVNVTRFVPPTLDDVRKYVRENNLQVDADNFFYYFTATGWVDSKGNNVTSWKGKVRTWASFNPQKPKQPFIDGGLADDLDLIESTGRRHSV